MDPGTGYKKFEKNTSNNNGTYPRSPSRSWIRNGPGSSGAESKPWIFKRLQRPRRTRSFHSRDVSATNKLLRTLSGITSRPSSHYSVPDTTRIGRSLAIDAEPHDDEGYTIPLGTERSLHLRSLRPFLNLVGGTLTLISLTLPWGEVNGMPLPLQYSGGYYAWSIPWIFAGGALSLLTSYGSILSILGMLIFASSPYNYYGQAWTPNLGFYFALTGLLMSMIGSTWTIPSLTGKIREIAGGLLWSTGFVLIATLVLTSMSPNGFIPPVANGGLIISFPLICVGTLLAVLGMRMIFYPTKNNLSQLRKD